MPSTYAYQNLLCCRNLGTGILTPQRLLSDHQQAHYKGTDLLLWHISHQTFETVVNLAGGWNKVLSYHFQPGISGVWSLVKLTNCPVHWKIVSYDRETTSCIGKVCDWHIQSCPACLEHKNPESVEISTAWLPDPQIQNFPTFVSTLISEVNSLR